MAPKERNSGASQTDGDARAAAQAKKPHRSPAARRAEGQGRMLRTLHAGRTDGVTVQPARKLLPSRGDVSRARLPATRTQEETYGT